MAIRSGSSGGGASSDAQLMFRKITVDDIEAKDLANGGTLYRIKDGAGKYYSTFDSTIAEELDQAQESGDKLLVCVEITKKGKYTNYTITATGDDAQQMQNTSGQQLSLDSSPATASSGGGYGGDWDREKDRKISHLSLFNMAIELTKLEYAAKPKDVDAETFIKGKVVDYKRYMTSLLEEATGSHLQESRPPVGESAEDVDPDEPPF